MYASTPTGTHTLIFMAALSPHTMCAQPGKPDIAISAMTEGSKLPLNFACIDGSLRAFEPLEDLLQSVTAIPAKNTFYNIASLVFICFNELLCLPFAHLSCKS